MELVCKHWVIKKSGKLRRIVVVVKSTSVHGKNKRELNSKGISRRNFSNFISKCPDKQALTDDVFADFRSFCQPEKLGSY